MRHFFQIMFLTLIRTLFISQIARGIVVYVCFLKGSNLDLIPKVGRFTSVNISLA